MMACILRWGANSTLRGQGVVFLSYFRVYGT